MDLRTVFFKGVVKVWKEDQKCLCKVMHYFITINKMERA